MRRSVMTIALTATGLLLSTTLAGCSSAAIEHRPAKVVAVPVKDRPPADLLACPAPARAFPTDQAASIPASIREPLTGLALAHRDLFDRLTRLINWNAPGTCPAERRQ